jgi:glycerophosphoryl diester phosphodiesterase
MSERYLSKLFCTFQISAVFMMLLLNVDDANADTKLWAFRGGNGIAPENTIEGMNLAFDYGASGTEIDLWQMPVEKEIVLLHDLSVDRTTNGTGLLHELTFDYVRSLDAGSFNQVGARFPGAQIPTLGEALSSIKQRDKDVLLHIKPDLFGFGTQANLSDINDTVDEVGFSRGNLFAWTPFEEDVIDYNAGIPGVQVIFQGTLDPDNVDWEHLIDIGVSGIAIPMAWQRPDEKFRFTQEFVDEIHANGLFAFVTDPREHEVLQAFEFGVDIAMTRKIDRYQPLLDDFNAVPEPCSVALLGMICVCGLARRRNRL